MKQFFLSAIVLMLLAACQNAPKNPKEPVDPAAATKEQQAFLNDSTKWTTVQWMDSVQNFGKVTDGEKVVITFHFKNTGTNPLVIANVTASCGCTVPAKPEEPIAPGQEGKITAEFNSVGRVGKASKYLNVTCNTKDQVVNLLFEGEVLPKK
ncbi:MAG: DUF1573 domain-containing protein [Chitinophagaceae bacterium]|nr:DUF1573 domain-containing protein [Chitinophagaceae bacterium]